MNGYRVISPNLDRRPDRWKVFQEQLLSQGVPADHIERFPSYDGRKYESTGHAMAHATELYNGNPSHYLATGQKLDKFNWCWNWSWYACLERIAQYTDNVPRLFVVDDYSPVFGYHEICGHIDIFTRIHTPFLIAQYGGPNPNSPSRVFNEPLPELPIFQRGLAGNWDICTLYSPAGARCFVDFINNTQEHLRPCAYGYEAHLNMPERGGIYGISRNIMDGFYDWVLQLPTATDDYVQDRQEIESLK